MLLTLLAPGPALGAQLQAGPNLLEIGPGSTATRLTLGNTTSSPITAQVRVFAWSQPDGEDRLTRSDDIAVSPAIIEVPPGVEQVVRLALMTPPARGRDRTYRVVVDELPGAPGRAVNGINLRMRYVIPAFVRAAESAEPALSCRIEAQGTRLVCENSGGRAAQLGASSLLDDRGKAVVLSNGLFGYVLPGSRRVWRLRSRQQEANGLHGHALRLDTRLNGQPTTIVVARAP